MRIFIAGATGVLGRRLIKQFVQKGHKVVGLAHGEKSVDLITQLGAEPVRSSIFDSDELARAVGRADVVIHAATSVPTKVSSKLKDWAMNDRLRREGTQSLTQAAARIGAKTYVQQSVIWVGRPADDSFFDEKTKIQKIDPLYTSAFDGENIALEAGEKHGFNTSVLRCSNFYAPDATHTRILAEGLLKRRLPLIGEGVAISANLHADDAANAYVMAAEAGKHGLWHVTDDDPVSIKDMFNTFARKLDAPAPWRIPLWLAKLFLWKGVIEFFTRSTRTSNQLFKRELGWSPRFSSFQNGLEEIVKTWRTEGLANSGGLR
jgi:nucleoside-diphosphate-sugar epimerase